MAGTTDKTPPPVVVAGYDGSPEARDALVLAKQFAKAQGTGLHVAFVQWDDNPAAERERFERLFSEIRRELGSQEFIRQPVRAASAKEGLHDLAERLSAGLITVGSTRRGPAGRVLIGSVGEELLHGAPCAVAIAPRGYADHEHFGLGLIGVGYDSTAEARLALAEAAALARRVGASVRLIGVVPRVGATGRIGGISPGYEQVVADDLAAELEAARVRLGPAIDAEVVMENGDAAEVLERNGVDLDLLVIGSRGHGVLGRVLLGSVAAKVMRTAPCPVVVTPRGLEIDARFAGSAASAGEGAE
jgi:nucleotide-binding universal stress UspA family protein